jgi:hypothetical protein
MATFKVGDRMRLKEDRTFTRSFPLGGYKRIVSPDVVYES